MFQFNTIEEALEDLKQGKIILVTDDEDRENEGDLVMAAEFATTETVNFIATYAKGLICMPADSFNLNRLKLPQMVAENTDNHSTAFTVSIDHVNTTTGISAEERAYTMKMCASLESKPEDFRRPGHVFPLEARAGGVLERNGHTEATVDLLKLAGLTPVGICCEIMKDDGTMARTDDLITFAQNHKLKFITIKSLVEYIQSNAQPAYKAVETVLPTRYGTFNIVGYVDNTTKAEHLALYMGDITSNEPVLTRIHSECMTGDTLGSLKCDCGQQYDYAMKAIAKEGRGVLLYMRQEGRNIGLINKLKAYKLQNEGLDTVEANLALGFPEDGRKYDVAAFMLKDLGVKCINVLTNNPDKIAQLESYGININERVPIEVEHAHLADFYLKTKKEKMGHILKEV
jgi:3,4-dihydroxy 2-butanone 4-phosphate synthase/GTP cyclohydrolase II